MDDQTIVEPRPVFKDDNNNGDNGGDGKIANDDKGGNKNIRTILIAVIAVIVLCCCCLAIGVAGWYGYTTISSVESSPEFPANQPIPQSDLDIPSGGLGNDILRNDTWQVMASASVALGCDLPIVSDTEIEVLQQPDSAGYWVEKWTVACQSGDTLAFEVEFITDATGVTFNIRPLFE